LGYDTNNSMLCKGKTAEDNHEQKIKSPFKKCENET
jgi:hypothetical protein